MCSSLWLAVGPTGGWQQEVWYPVDGSVWWLIWEGCGGRTRCPTYKIQEDKTNAMSSRKALNIVLCHGPRQPVSIAHPAYVGKKECSKTLPYLLVPVGNDPRVLGKNLGIPLKETIGDGL